jgi:hypothetical protein
MTGLHVVLAAGGGVALGVAIGILHARVVQRLTRERPADRTDSSRA